MTNSTSRTRIVLIAIAAIVIYATATTITHAADPSLATMQTIASGVPGVNNQTLTATTTQVSAAEVKATRTFTVNTAPTTTQTLSIGNCAITFATTTAGSGPAEDTDCNGGVTIRTTTGTASDTPRTAIQIATVLLSLTNATSTSHGNLAVTASTTASSSVVFTTSGSESSATAIAYTPGTASGITSPFSVSGVVALPQISFVTPANVETGDIFTATINSTGINYTATASTVANVTAGLASAINASSQGSVVTASNQSTSTSITALSSGTAFTLATSTTNHGSTTQSVTFTPADVAAADFVVTINGTDYTYRSRIADAVADVSYGLTAALSSVSGIACTNNISSFTCVSTTPGTPFTYSTSVTPVVTHRGGGGGGGGRSSSSSTVTTTTTTPVMGTTSTGSVTTTTTTSTNASVASWPVMTTGAKGASVIALQTWLLAKGYSIPAGATGYFGAQTTAALAAYQKASGIMPSVGYFGPITRAYIAAH